MGKGERGSVRPLIFGVDVFSRHKTRPVSRRDETIHPRKLCYLNDLPNAFLALELPRAPAVGNLWFCIKHNATNGSAQFFLLVRFIHIVCCEERGRVLRMCWSPAPFCNLQSLCNGAGPFCTPYPSRPLRVSNERPRLKAFCRVAFSVRFKLWAMLAARVFLLASRFNVRMSRLVHARLFIDLLR
jgi:hypothetical protein